jgi:hypothetical protein
MAHRRMFEKQAVDTAPANGPFQAVEEDGFRRPFLPWWGVTTTATGKNAQRSSEIGVSRTGAGWTMNVSLCII